MNCFLHSSNIKCSFLLLLWQQRSMVWHIIGLAKKQQQEQKNEESFRRSKKSGIHSHKLVHAFSTHYEKKSDGGARTRTLTLGVPTFEKISSILAGINISKNFSWGFQKCKSYQCRTLHVNAKLLSSKPTQIF